MEWDKGEEAYRQLADVHAMTELAIYKGNCQSGSKLQWQGGPKPSNEVNDGGRSH